MTGFTLGYHKSHAGFHTRDMEKPFIGMQARSLDGGETWEVQETPCRKAGNTVLSAGEDTGLDLGVGWVLENEEGLRPCPGGPPASPRLRHPLHAPTSLGGTPYNF